jgi:hypothetical protein
LMGDHARTRETLVQWSVWRNRGVPRQTFDQMFNAAIAPYRLPKDEAKNKADAVWAAVDITSKTLRNVTKQATSVFTARLALPPPVSGEQLWGGDAQMDQSFNLQYLQLQQGASQEIRQWSLLKDTEDKRKQSQRNDISNVR